MHGRSPARRRPLQACRSLGAGAARGPTPGEARRRRQDRPAGRPDVQLRHVHLQRRQHRGCAADHRAPRGVPGRTHDPRLAARLGRVPRRAARGPVQVPAVGGRHQHRALRPRELPGQRQHRRAPGVPRADGQVRPARGRLARLHERGPAGTRASTPRRSSAPTTSAPAASPILASPPTPPRSPAPRRSTGWARRPSRPASGPPTSTTTRTSSIASTSRTASPRRRTR